MLLASPTRELFSFEGHTDAVVLGAVRVFVHQAPSCNKSLSLFPRPESSTSFLDSLAKQSTSSLKTRPTGLPCFLSHWATVELFPSGASHFKLWQLRGCLRCTYGSIQIKAVKGTRNLSVYCGALTKCLFLFLTERFLGLRCNILSRFPQQS